MQKNTVLILLFFLPFFVFSQNFNGGVLAGMTATQVDGDGYGGYHRAGAIAGVWVGHGLTNQLSIRTELKFIQKGSYQRFTDGAGGTTGFYSLRLNYIDMPYLLEYHFRDDIVPFAGLSIGFLWKAKESDASGSYPEEDIAMFRKMELAATAGAEYKITKSISFCASISYSMLPVRPHKGLITYRLNQGQYNNVLQFYFRYRF